MAEIYGRLTRRPGVLLGQGPLCSAMGWRYHRVYLSSSRRCCAVDRLSSISAVFMLACALPAGRCDRRLGELGRAARFRVRHYAILRRTTRSARVQATQLGHKHSMACAAGSGPPSSTAMLSLAGTVSRSSQPTPTRPPLPARPPHRPAETGGVEARSQASLAAQKPVVVAGTGFASSNL